MWLLKWLFMLSERTVVCVDKRMDKLELYLSQGYSLNFNNYIIMVLYIVGLELKHQICRVLWLFTSYHDEWPNRFFEMIKRGFHCQCLFNYYIKIQSVINLKNLMFSSSDLLDIRYQILQHLIYLVVYLCILHIN